MRTKNTRKNDTDYYRSGYFSCSRIFLFSTLVSFINEIIALIINSRGRLLKRSLKELVNDIHGNSIVDKLYGSSHISKLRIFSFLKSKGYLPSYISSDSFVDAFKEILAQDGEIKTLADLEAKIESNITNPFLKRKLLSIIHELSSQSLELGAFREKLKAWYDQYMLSVTEVYKLRSRVFIFCISIAVCIVLNVDTINISKYLYRNGEARELMVNFAQKLEADEIERQKYAVKVDTPKIQNNASQDKQLEVLIAKHDTLVTKINSFDLPLSWTWEKFYEMKKGWNWIEKLLGILVTACCLALGAPFWFQIMKSLLQFRKPKVE